MDETDAIDRQEPVTQSFDLRGNALKEVIRKEYYDTESGGFVFIEMQEIENKGYDFHDRVAESYIHTYNNAAMTDLRNMQHIVYMSYDRHGNAAEQTIDTFTTPSADPMAPSA